MNPSDIKTYSGEPSHHTDSRKRFKPTLSQFPKQHPLVDDKILASWGIRFTQIGNYPAFYVISEDEQQANRADDL